VAKRKPEKADDKAKPKKAKKKQQRTEAETAAVAAEPVFTAEPVQAPPADPATALDAAEVTPRTLLDRLSGSKLCYGEPVASGDRTVVPVSRVRVAGGFGGSDEGEGGGGAVDATPVGYIEVGPGGAQFRPIADPDRTLRVARSVAVTAAALLGALAALRSLTR
jgi:hypothetical protein